MPYASRSIGARVATAAVVRFGVKPVPLIDLESASQYWPISDPLLERYREDDLREMRRCSVEFVVNAKRYRILHPHALVTVQPQRLTGGYWNLDCGEPLDDKDNQS